METFPDDLFETMKTKIVGGDERQVGGVRVMETTE